MLDKPTRKTKTSIIGLKLASLFTFFLLTLHSCQQKKEHNTLRLNLCCEPPTLDLREATDTTSMNVLLMLFEGLTRFNGNNEAVLAAAESVALSEDGCTYTFYLRDHLWSNGDRVTAHDYVATWRAVLDPNFPAPFAYKFFCIKGAQEVRQGAPAETLAVRALDVRTLEVNLNHPVPYFLELIALPTFYPLHMSSISNHPNWAKEVGPFYVCNGPFIMKSWEHESELILRKNRFYWDQSKVHLNSIHLAMVADPATEFYMFEMGELDWAGSPLSSLPLDFIPNLGQEGKLNHYTTNGVYYYKLNTESPPLNNMKVRRALALSIDREAIITHILQADQRVATAFVPGNSSFFQDHSPEAPLLFAEGLREENYTSTPTLTLCYNSNSQHQKIAQAIQQQWKTALNLDVQLESCDWKVYLDKISTQNYQIARLGWIGEHSDPISYLEPFKTKSQENNETGWENEEFRTLIEASNYELDREKRLAMLHDAEAILMDEMPIIPIYFLNNSYLKKPYVKGAILTSLGTIDLKEARIER